MNMQNRVGSVIPSAQDIEKLVKDVENVGVKLAKFTLMLSAAERQPTTKMRANADRIVGLVGDLATQHELSLPRISVGDMKDDLTLAQRLMPLSQALARVSQTVADTILQAQSECWWAATAFYTALSRLSDADPHLESELKPAVEFFARRRKAEPLVPA
jgi:hypothetical protein